ncbi:Bax inhibitor-1/YccA family protein [Sungkyunkwania multivorans]|uniref:Bax inhibitor-1/YccA family protein n=1 Tax=Sungkyunkwania multivorans TaxID=1173618 RepID=A0ABW3D1A2_9FLAO
MAIFGLSTSNPAFTNHFWDRPSRKMGRMSIRGILIKSLFCLALTSITAGYTWKLFFEGANIKWYTNGGIIVSLICSVLISFKPQWAKWLVIIYALSKGFLLGGISAYVHKSFPGFPFQAVGMTLITFFVMLLLYSARIIKVTKQFKSVVISAAVTIFTIYIITWILRFFDIEVSFIRGTSWFAIGFNVIAAIVASLSLLLDFDYIERYRGRAPKEREWIATWGLLVTLIWLYVEILRLMRKLATRF